jgi:hypothetical protein
MATLIVSIDFELRWGVLDRLEDNIEQYKSNIMSVHKTLPWMLKIFEERGISATWATVGAIGCEDWKEFEEVRPKLEPSYANEKLKYVNEFNQTLDPEGELYFAPQLIRNIIQTPQQELGTHTFGHIYGTEAHVSYDEFKSDLLVARNFLKDKFGILTQSLVYPRNQVIYEEKLIEDNIISYYRGNENVSHMSAKNQKEKILWNRIKILSDALNPFVSHKYTINEIENNNIRSSAMFRIYLSEYLRKIHLAKLKSNIKHLGDNEMYHIWYHPHNLGASQKRKDDFIRFFDFIGNQISKGELTSENMGSLAKRGGI